MRECSLKQTRASSHEINLRRKCGRSLTDLCEPCDASGGHATVLGIVRFVSRRRIFHAVARGGAVVVIFVIGGAWRVGRRERGGDGCAIALLEA